MWKCGRFSGRFDWCVPKISPLFLHTLTTFYSICWKHNFHCNMTFYAGDKNSGVLILNWSLNSQVFGNNKCDAFSWLLPDFECLFFISFFFLRLLLNNSARFRTGIGAIYLLGQHFTHIITHFHTYLTHSLWKKEADRCMKKKICSRNKKEHQNSLWIA